ncbi:MULTISPECIES: hypothetical protein [unclassified Colwellia]|uniref:hypothetical protein n=1 Tax=unclassified Colwellia TaxID=196834 RepID=UPI0015F5A8B7|nr:MULTISPECIES: hypothetical protein [unclassified Colwellia]MBA6230590.1 hypothetical protein [Colwellia sp. MB02u-7]MBA6236600.1 hypothetical protein [Colwellia sp. MB02u-11]MBA6255843.1 hypothetical protein [Colwellia sp. MB3u-28]MBA6261983.1 hypothetical protein [Colwellia sp. MB3u-41]MBA6297949.1 hypothetical protein [Colwellia sp. MB3u-22]
MKIFLGVIASILFFTSIQINTENNKISLQFNTANAVIIMERIEVPCDYACQHQFSDDWVSIGVLYDDAYGEGAFAASGFNMSAINLENIRAQLVARCYMQADAAIPACVSELQYALIATGAACSVLTSSIMPAWPLGTAVGIAVGVSCGVGVAIVNISAENICANAVESVKKDCMKIGL